MVTPRACEHLCGTGSTSGYLAHGVDVYPSMTAIKIDSFPAHRVDAARELIAKSYARVAAAARKLGGTAPATPELRVVAMRTSYACTMCCAPAGGAFMRGERCQYAHCEGTYWGREVVDLEIDSADRPCVAGWEFLAVVEPLEGGNLVRQVPFADVAAGELDTYRAGDQLRCDHCKTVRRRTETFVVRHEDPVVGRMLVGRNCLADFLGGKSAAAILASLALVDQIRECGEGDGGFGGARDLPFQPVEFHAQVAAIVRVSGFVSRAKAQEIRDAGGGGESTSDTACYLLSPPPSTPQARDAWYEARQAFAVTDADTSRAGTVLAWVGEQAPTSDYLQNLTLVCRQSAVQRKHAGIAASAVSAWERATGAALKTAREVAGCVASAHQGTVGEKIERVLTVERVTDFEGQYGTKHLHSLRDAAGNAYVWSTGSARLDVETSGTYHGTVKRHTEFRGEQQTELTRLTEGPIPTVKAKRARKAKAEVTTGSGGKLLAPNVDHRHSMVEG